MATTTAAKFHENFWGMENKGFDVLLQNMKAGINASKELGEFVKERIVAEDTYVKGLSKLQKSVQHIPEATLGSFSPLWELLKTMCDKLVKVHSQFVKMLSDLSREISDYHHTQKEKIKTNMRGDIEHAQEALQKYQATEALVHRSKKHYLQSAEEAIKARVKLEKIKIEASSNPKLKQRLTEAEVRAKQSQSWMNTQKSDHQDVVKQHCGLLMEFQGKMSEACSKFESLEEEHLAQMVTFMIKVARTQDTTHSSQAEVYSILNSEMDIWTVEKLLKEFVEKKGTGKEKPTPQKFREADTDTSLSVSAVKTPQLSRSTEDLSVSNRHGSKTERKATFRPFGKKKKNSVSQASGASSNGTTTETSEQQPAGPEVDAEGYSIRPEDAANISKFPDDPWGKKDDFSDSSDSEDEREKKIRAIKIRENSAQPAATIEDLKATVKNLKLGSVSPTGMRKASSSQSLNILTSTTATTTTTARRSANTSGVSETKPDPDNSQPSLLDLDTVFSSDGGGASQMPTPLKPTSSTASKTPHIAPPLLPSPPLGIRGAGASSGGSSSGGGPVIATTSFNTKPLDPSASLPPWSFSSPPAAAPNSSMSSILTPTSITTTPADSSTAAALSTDTSTTAPQNTGSGSTPNILDTPTSAEPNITRPRSNSLKSEDSLANSIPAPPIPAKRRSRGTTGPVKPIAPITNSPILAPHTPPLQPTQMSNGQDPQSPKIPSLNSSIQTPPLSPATRGSSLLQMSHNASLPNASMSPLVTSKTMNDTSGSSTPAQKQIPLAVAVMETCNAIYKGTDFDSCMVKVTGEVCLSFPTSYLSKISPSAPLQFRVEKKRLKLDRILHNQHLLKKGDEEGVFAFNMSALADFLTKMKEKEANKSYYIIPALKYDVQVDGGGVKLPLQLKSYMKCEQAVTNFRLDYMYDSSVFTPAGKTPNLTKVVFSVPVDGGVQNVLSKPNGAWLPDKETLTWTVGNLPSVDGSVSGQLQAKFSIASGPSHPSTAMATFECEGASLSGLGVELLGSDYTMYLLKERCQSGKYMSEPKI